MDNLLLYLKNNLGNHLLISGNRGDLLIWGTRSESDVLIKGFSYNIPSDIKKITNEEKHLFLVGQNMSNELSLPIIGIRYPLDLLSNTDSILTINKEEIRSSKASSFIQSILNTDFKKQGTSKKINSKASDVFHAWARRNMPTQYIRVDIDALIQNQKDHNPKAIIEIKRSTRIEPKDWTPFTDDASNYLIQLILADKLNIPFITLQHSNLTEDVLNETQIGIHLIKQVTMDPVSIMSTKRLLSANEIVSYIQETICEGD